MAHATILAPETLREHLEDAAWTIVDCRHTLADVEAGRRAYGESHIPGAFFASVETDMAGARSGANGRHPMPSPQDFARFLRSLGVDDGTQIVAYDAGADMFAARFWFLCRWIGHRACAVLDGGLAAWNALDYPLTTSPPPRPREGTIEAHAHADMLVDADHVLRHLESDKMHLVDARGADRFAGENETIDPVAGHIPGARNRPFRENFREDSRLKSPERLRAEFEAAGISPESAIHQCGSGVSATVNLLAMEHAGLTGSRLYPGSWSEWIADPKRPLARL